MKCKNYDVIFILPYLHIIVFKIRYDIVVLYNIVWNIG